MRQLLIKKQVKRGLILSLFLLLISIPTMTGHSSELNFYVNPILPASQVEGSTAYFDINLPPGETETLGLSLVNASSEPIDVLITAHTAYTNVNGVVVYAQEAEEVDSTLVYEMSDLIETPDLITLAPGEARDVFVNLTLPDEDFTGLLAGGINIEEVEKEDESSDEEGLVIKNTFSVVYAVVASNNRSTVTPELELLDVFADHLNHRNVFSATIQNPTPTFVNQLEVNAQVREVGSDEILYEAHRTGMQMAPNSHFKFPIPLDGDRFRNGDYVLTMTASSGKHTWSWEEGFTVDTQTARELNEGDVTIDTSLNLWMVSSISLAILFFLILIYLIFKHRKLKQQLDEHRRSRLE